MGHLSNQRSLHLFTGVRPLCDAQLLDAVMIYFDNKHIKIIVSKAVAALRHTAAALHHPAADRHHLRVGLEVEEIGKIIGADSIGFLSLEACDKLAADSHCGFCKGCFCGKYPVDPPLVTEKNKFDQPIHGGKVQDDD